MLTVYLYRARARNVDWLCRAALRFSKPLQLRRATPPGTSRHWTRPQGGTLVASSFDTSDEGWRVARNGAAESAPRNEPVSWQRLNQYIHATDALINLEVDEDALQRWIANDHDYVVSALGPEGPDRLEREWRRLGATLEQQGRHFFNAALDQLMDISQGH